jgi:hypothetical protein
MAKPGSPDAARLTRQPVEDASPEARSFGEVEAGLRCAGCGERVRKGWEFTVVRVLRDPTDLSGKRVTGIKTVIACGREECDYAFRAGKEATAMRQVAYMFLDEEPMASAFGHAASGTVPAERTPVEEEKDDGSAT